MRRQAFPPTAAAEDAAAEPEEKLLESAHQRTVSSTRMVALKTRAALELSKRAAGISYERTIWS